MRNREYGCICSSDCNQYWNHILLIPQLFYLHNLWCCKKVHSIHNYKCKYCLRGKFQIHMQVRKSESFVNPLQQEENNVKEIVKIRKAGELSSGFVLLERELKLLVMRYQIAKTCRVFFTIVSERFCNDFLLLKTMKLIFLYLILTSWTLSSYSSAVFLLCPNHVLSILILTTNFKLIFFRMFVELKRKLSK